MKLQAGAIGMIVSLFLLSSVYAEPGVDPQVSPQEGVDQQQGSGAAPDAQGKSPQGSSDMGGALPGGAMHEGASSPEKGKQAGWPSVSGVQQLQQKLKDQGFEAGPVDGKFGPKTKEALRKFQEKNGIKPSGEADEQTLAALGIQGGASGQDRSPQGDMGGGQPGPEVQFPEQPGEMGGGSPLDAGIQNPDQGSNPGVQPHSDVEGSDPPSADSGSSPSGGNIQPLDQPSEESARQQ